ncbi:MAG: DDE-type integrase/transposase/recombinase [Oscillospiraceae bacterium]|nr:DDE-type integrase/transposase/recombinase [Oscillospiraceae bacterium]
MKIVTQPKAHSKRYLPHTLATRINAVKLYRQTHDIDFVLRRYHVSKASLMRWNKRYDGTKESLMDKSHRPHTPHPNAHTEEELKWIKDYHRRTPNIGVCELYGKLLTEKGYSRHAGLLYRVLVRLGYRKKPKSKKKKTKHTGHYDTPTVLGEKWQMDVKHVPVACYVGTDGDKFYQYTMIEEASRERFIYAYKEASSYSTVDFVQRAIRYFGYAPNIIQTDNGTEFCHTQKTTRTHPLDALCQHLHIVHKQIRPKTPWHNGKVERSHRNDQERFYNYLRFYSYEDLQLQMKRYLRRSNRIPSSVLGWKTPLQKRHELETTRFC